MTEEMNDNSKTFTTAMSLISNNANIPAQFKDEFAVFEMVSENNKLDELNGQTVKPLVIFYNTESFKSSETGETEDGVKTYILVQHQDGTVKMYSGFSQTFRIKSQLLQGVFKNNLPMVEISKVSKGMKQEYIIRPIKE